LDSISQDRNTFKEWGRQVDHQSIEAFVANKDVGSTPEDFDGHSFSVCRLDDRLQLVGVYGLGEKRRRATQLQPGIGSQGNR
jgi:hypothetical protein